MERMERMVRLEWVGRLKRMVWMGRWGRRSAGKSDGRAGFDLK